MAGAEAGAADPLVPLPSRAAEPRLEPASDRPGLSRRPGGRGGAARFICVRAAEGEPACPCRAPRWSLRSMSGPRLLAALCGALLGASGLFAASGECTARARARALLPARARMSAARLPPPLLFTNLGEAPGPCGGATSPTRGGDARGLRCCLRAWGS